jgi:uncharacterized protein DUF6551
MAVAQAAALTEFPVPRRIETLPLAVLKRAPYQRELDDLWVRRIISSFDARLVRRPWVSLRDGDYWLVDGQHTVGGLADLGIDAIECEILEGLTYADEARLHDSIQRLRKAPRLYDSYRALLEAGDPEVVGLRDCIERHGYRIQPRGGGAGSIITAVGALWKVWRTTPARDVGKALDAMREWKAIERSIPGYVLAGVCLFVRDARSYDDKRLKVIIRQNAPGQIELKVKDFGPQGVSSGARPVKARNAIANLYNRGLNAEERVTFKDEK